MRIVICGTRGSTQAPGVAFSRYGGHTSCVALARDGAPPSLLLDAGTGIRRVSGLLDGAAFTGAILLGHLHWDHTHGLPFFRAGDRPDARVDLYLPAQDGDAEAVLARGFSPPHFPIRPSELRGEWGFRSLEEGIHHIEGFRVLAREIPHKGGRTFGYRVEDGQRALAYLSDHHPAALGAGPEGFGPYHEAALELAEGVDVLLHDAQYLATEWPERAGFGHSTVGYAVGLATAARVRTLALFHHDPARTDDEVTALTRQARDAAPVEVIAAAEGQVLDLPRCDD
ncbi:MAG: MBL fold metallo-hydrolase [Egibacteraceae bacterium]